MKPNIIPAEVTHGAAESLSPLTRLARFLLISQLRKVRYGRLRLVDAGADETFGTPSAEAPFEDIENGGCLALHPLM